MNDAVIRRMANRIAGAYIQVMGQEKWDSLTEQEQHDVIMILAKDMLKAVTRMEEMV